MIVQNTGKNPKTKINNDNLNIINNKTNAKILNIIVDNFLVIIAKSP